MVEIDFLLDQDFFFLLKSFQISTGSWSNSEALLLFYFTNIFLLSFIVTSTDCFNTFSSVLNTQLCAIVSQEITSLYASTIILFRWLFRELVSTFCTPVEFLSLHSFYFVFYLSFLINVCRFSIPECFCFQVGAVVSEISKLFC